jgi:class 3 adenylate cyclase/pimeloyl-ACP methyl ester carboxylesterase
MNATPTTRYARSADGTYIAFQAFGDGPDLLIAFPWISHLELFWEDPDVGPWLRSLARFARVITMDQRGIGLSDRMTQVIDLETKVDDVRAVLDAADSERTTLYGQGVDGGSICAMFAATYPERTIGVVFWSGQTCGGIQADYPWRIEAGETASFLRLIADTWGDADTVGPLLVEAGIESIADDPVARARWARTMRNAASRGDALTHERMFDETDFRSILPAIHVPSVILQPAWDEDSVAQGEWMTSQLQGSRLVRLPHQIDFPPYLGETEANLKAMREFLADLHAVEAEFDRVLATVLFTDIVDSTAQGAAMGDRTWREIRERHDEIVRANLARFRGREIKTMGDGFLATFDGPARGVRCAQAIATGVEPLGIEIRAGLHTGEVAIEGDDVSGVGVAIGARVGAKASASEVLVSQTVKDLVAGSGLTFEDAGEHELKGVPDRWRLYRAVA